VQWQIPEALLECRLLAFSLQPVVENAIKHGISQMLEPGCLTLAAEVREDYLQLVVSDNAGLYQPPADKSGLGMNIVDRRIKARYGEQYGVRVECEPQRLTRVIITLPLTEVLC